MGETVTIGIPVYRGERFLAETLASVQAQTHRDFEALISIDGPDPVCEEICRPALADSRFRLTVRPERLGWVGHINWLMRQAGGDFWYFQQQDDLIEPEYLAVLLDHARSHPEAALVSCELRPFGAIEGWFPHPPEVRGETAFSRQMTMLVEQLAAFAFRGLTRVDALRTAGEIVTNDCENYGVDTTWLASVALHGELHRVPLPLYRKRYHDNNTESKWWRWGRERRLEAWSCHCVDMLRQAMRAEATPDSRRLLFLAAATRTVRDLLARPFFPDGEFRPVEREQLVASFLSRSEEALGPELALELEADWSEIRGWARAAVARRTGA